MPAGRPQLVWQRIVADTETPVAAMLKLAEPGSGAFLLESVEGGAVRGRYSLLGLAPDLVWRATGDRAEVNRRWQHDRAAFEPCGGGVLDELRALVAACRNGGAAGATAGTVWCWSAIWATRPPG